MKEEIEYQLVKAEKGIYEFKKIKGRRKEVILSKMKIIELFAGIGACSKALENLGIDIEIVDAVEIDKYAIKSFNAIHNTNFETQDIKTYNKTFNDIDLISHGSPCQDFSVAGKQAGGDFESGTRSSLLYESIRIVNQIKPKYVLWENVKNILSQKHKHNFDNYIKTLEELGYNNYYQVLNAKDYGVPQNRERVYTISIRKDIDKGTFKFPEKEKLHIRLKDMLEDKVDEKYYLNEKMLNGFIKHNEKHIEKGTGFIWKPKSKNDIANCLRANASLCPTDNTLLIKNNTKQGYLEAYDGDSVNLEQPNSKTRRGRVGKQVSQTLTTSCNQGVIIGSTQKHAAISYDGVVPTLTSAMGQGGGHVPMHNYDYRIRKLTPKECWRLMGFNDEDFEKAKGTGNSNTQLYKQAGNSIVVKVLEKIFKNLLKES